MNTTFLGAILGTQFKRHSLSTCL